MRVVFFDIDCLRPDHLGCYGYPRSTSPAIDSIATEGMRFNRYYCSSSPCLPSRAVRTRTHLFLKTYDDAGCEFEPIELYDIDADPFQTRNLAQSLPEVTTRCKGLLADWEAAQMRKRTSIEDPLHAILAERCQ